MTPRVEALLRDPVILDALARLAPLAEALREEAEASTNAKPRRRRPAPAPKLPPRPDLTDEERANIGAALARRGYRST